MHYSDQGEISALCGVHVRDTCTELGMTEHLRVATALTSHFLVDGIYSAFVSSLVGRCEPRCAS